MRTESYFHKSLGGSSATESHTKNKANIGRGLLEQDYLNGHKVQLVYL